MRATCRGCASRSSSRPDRPLFLVECRPIVSCTEHVPSSCGGRVIKGEEALRVDSVLVPLDDVVEDGVLAVRLLIGLIEGALGIGFVFREQQIGRAYLINA